MSYSMKHAHLYVFGIVAAVLCAYAYFELWHQPDSAEKFEAEKKVLSFKPDDVQKLVIQASSGKIVLARNPGKKTWHLEEPVQAPAIESMVRVALEELSSAEKLSILATQKDAHFEPDLTRFGLNPGALRIEVRTPQKLYLLDMGNPTPMPGSSYARVGSGRNGEESQIVVIPSSMTNLLSKPAYEWRDKRALFFEVHDVQRIVLKTPSREIELKRNKNLWEMLRPLKRPVDAVFISGLLEELYMLQIKDFVADRIDPLTLANHGLAPAAYTVEIETDDEKEKLLFGGQVPDRQDQIFATHTTYSSLFILDQKILAALDESASKILNPPAPAAGASQPASDSVHQEIRPAIRPAKAP